MDKFAFIIHPLSLKDVFRYEPAAANKKEALILKILEWMPAYKASHITGIVSAQGVKTEGWFIMCPLLPSQFMSLPRDKVYQKIVDCGKIAKSLGAKIIGLGGYSSVVGDAGITVASQLDIAVTSGNSYTIASSIEGTLEAVKLMEIEIHNANAAVVGATGSIGSVCAKLLSREVRSLTLISRNRNSLKRVAESVYYYSGKEPQISTNIEEALPHADIVISASSSGGGIIKPPYLKPGAVVCDVALPHDVCRDVAESRPDVLVIEGGLIEVPGDNLTFNFDFGYPPEIALACMSETIILTLEKRFENFSLGRSIDISKVIEISAIARKHGFRLAGLRSFDRQITISEIEAIKEKSRKANQQKRMFF